MDFYSYSPRDGMRYHATRDEAKQAAESALKYTLLPPVLTASTDTITWGEVTERAAATGEVGFALKRQDRLTYEATNPLRTWPVGKLITAVQFKHLYTVVSLEH